MSNSSLIQIRVDDQLKQEVTDIYDRLGLDLPTAIRMFLKKSIVARGLPFEATLPEKTVTRQEALDILKEYAVLLSDMSPDEIGEEIAAARKEQKQSGE